MQSNSCQSSTRTTLVCGFSMFLELQCATLLFSSGLLPSTAGSIVTFRWLFQALVSSFALFSSQRAHVSSMVERDMYRHVRLLRKLLRRMASICKDSNSELNLKERRILTIHHQDNMKIHRRTWRQAVKVSMDMQSKEVLSPR